MASPLEEAARRAAAVIADLEAELRALAESTAAGPDDEHDAEGSTIGLERARVAALLERARAHARELSSAVDRAGSGDYGRCVACGAAIEPERLAILPATTVCATCARG